MKILIEKSWTEVLWPPRRWWLDRPWGSLLLNHPVAHLLQGIVMQSAALVAFWLVRWAFGLPVVSESAAAVLRLLWTAWESGKREEDQMEDWSDRGGYPLYSATWDTLFAILGGVLVELVLWIL